MLSKMRPNTWSSPKRWGFCSRRASSVTLTERTDEEKLKDLGFGAGCATVYDHLAQNMQLIEKDGLEAVPELRRSLEGLGAFKRALLMPREVGSRAKASRSELISAVDDVAHLYKTMVRVSRGVLDQQAVGRATRRYDRGVARIEQFARIHSFSGRLL